MKMGVGPIGWSLAALAVWVSASGAVSQTTRQPAKLDFSRDVLPILSDKCFVCHGPDSGSRQAGLRLDNPESAFAERGEGRYAIVPGNPKKSLLVERIHNADAPMPPAVSGKTLSEPEKKILERWISEGAEYGKLWSFQPVPKSVPVPKSDSRWPRDPIDRFILSRMTAQGLSPSKPASRERWLRRVTLDLTGLPPAESEIASFLQDKGAGAYEKVVDRLLASPRFGERMAVEWLDAARYSDSYGYQSDLLSPTWPYRDWVVRAFNANMPYHHFLMRQLAGDLLAGATRDDILATAFNRLHRQSNEGGSIPLEFKTIYAADRVDTFGTAMLGLTLGCARCHDHKFDPVTQREYYQLFAYFNNIDEYGLLLSTEVVPTPSILLPTPVQEAKRKELLEQIKALNVGRRGLMQFLNWIWDKPDVSSFKGPSLRLSLDSLDSGKFVNAEGGASFGEPVGAPAMVPGQKGLGLSLSGDNGLTVRALPAKERYDAFTWTFWLKDTLQVPEPVVVLHRTGGTDVGFCGFDLMLEDGYLTARVMRHWPGNAISIRTVKRIRRNEWTHIGWSYDGSSRASGLRLYLNGVEAQTEVLADSVWKRINAYGDLGPSVGDWSFGQRFRDLGFKGGMLDEVTFSDRSISEVEVAQLFDGHSLDDAIRDPKAHQTELYEFHMASLNDGTASVRKEIRRLYEELIQVEEGILEVSVMQEAEKEIPAYVLARGQYDAPRTEQTRVKRGTPAALPKLAAKGDNNRLALAEWLVRDDHPLTSRVAVNRLWQMLFGVGLVETSENFGIQGSRPTHPELLDYMARAFMDSGWDVKKMLRRLVLSSTYRQDSSFTQTSLSKDPLNHFYARGPSRRLTAEMARDTVLAASGLMDDRIGGPPVNPYQPAGIWRENNTMSPEFVQSKGKDLYRRSLYSTWKRTTPVPSMMTFDATSREACTVRRPSTSTPLQALVLLNDVQFVEAARALAERALGVGGGPLAQISYAFAQLAGRNPDKEEAAILLRMLGEQRSLFKDDPQGAARLIAMGESKRSDSVNPVELAAMTVTVQAVLNSDAVMWKR